MSRKREIQNAYKYLGKEATFYDGMITCSTILGKAACKVVWFIEKLYTPKGFFTPPYETVDSLKTRLESTYSQVIVNTVESMGCFTCVKGE